MRDVFMALFRYSPGFFTSQPQICNISKFLYDLEFLLHQHAAAVTNCPDISNVFYYTHFILGGEITVNIGPVPDKKIIFHRL